jgi:malate synthase
VRAGDALTLELFRRLLGEEHQKLLQAGNKDVHDDSKETTLPVAREIVERYVVADVKPPWYVDLLNLCLDNHDLARVRERIAAYLQTLSQKGSRMTENQDFVTHFATAARSAE